jgi:hypothetical protein
MAARNFNFGISGNFGILGILGIFGNAKDQP